MNKKLVMWLHMHQPNYLNPQNNEQIVPWTRRHMLRGYYEIPKLLSQSSAKININFSGTLLKQIVRYAEGKLKDSWQILEEKDASLLSESEKTFIIRNFLEPIPHFNSARFNQLIEKRKMRERFNIQDIRDAQMLFALSAFSPLVNEADELLNKKQNYTETDKETEKTVENKIMQSIIPLYKMLFQRNQIALTVSPMYHPILPLLLDSSIAKISKPNVILPGIRFAYAEDAVKQIDDAIAVFKETFGTAPQGMWPSEGSVSDETIDIVKIKGIKWIGTDQSILYKTRAGIEKDGVFLSDVRGVKVFFRDRELSDKIGFTYNSMNEKDAVKDLLQKLEASKNGEVIITDGENPWDSYPKYGVPFLKELFSALDEKNSALCSEATPENKLESIQPGSWINGCFDTWIGDEETNRAWTYLYDARAAVGKIKEALDEIYIAEGSDWFWWYSNFHKKEVDFTFDILFRTHLLYAYKKALIKAPSYLFQPIKEEK